MLRWALTCLGWTLKLRAFETLLRFQSHQDVGIRLSVANNIVGCAQRLDDPELLRALVNLCHDEDEEVRYAALWEVREHITIRSEAILNMLNRRLGDSSVRIRKLAEEAIDKGQ